MMQYIDLGKSGIKASEISLGCMRLTDISQEQASILIHTALDQGINFFDHADCYGEGQCEEIFAKAINMNPGIRDKIFIQTKCGLRDGYFDFSKEHILEAVEGSLKRLQTEYIDVLLLHRPDALAEPEEVAEAFSLLQAAGKVRYFGVSNQNPMQIQLLSKYLNQRLIVNQLQFSVTHTGLIDAGLHVNMKDDASVDRDNSTLDYCRFNEITVQAWSPFQFGFFEGAFLGNDQFPLLNQKIDEIAARKNVANSAIAIAWILRHPAKIQPIVGTMNASRLIEICKASDICLSRPEWYDIYKAAGNKLP